jgi:N-dimethylarginine dimethylaminohydrolase
VLLKHARSAFVSQDRIDEQWRDLGYTLRPEFHRACVENDRFARLLESLGVTVEWMPDRDAGIDSLYTRDASLVTDAGVIPARMGKPARRSEPDDHAAALAALGLSIAGRIEEPGSLEGGDVTWLSPDKIAVGRGYRTNRAGIDQLEQLLGDEVDLLEVPLPHWKGPHDVFHLMSVISPIAPDLALVYSPLLPVPFREALLDGGFSLVEVPDDEFESLGGNVLAVAPRVAVAVAGNPLTRRRLEAAGVEVHLYEGDEISLKGCGGPTCLARTLERE